jgi:hypothetical protein
VEEETVMNAAVERMWTARKKMCIGYDNAMGLLMLGWRIILKSRWLPYPRQNPVGLPYEELSVTIQSLDKKEWKRLYRPTFEKLRRRNVIEVVGGTSPTDGDTTTILAIKKGE